MLGKPPTQVQELLKEHNFVRVRRHLKRILEAMPEEELVTRSMRHEVSRLLIH